MEKLNLKLGEFQKMPLNRAFDGFKASCVAIANDQAAGNLTAVYFNPDKVNVKLINKINDDVIWDLSLAELSLVFRAGQLENKAFFSPAIARQTLKLAVANPVITIVDCSFEFPTMHGDYELHVRVASDAIGAAANANSYVVISPNASTEAMEYQTRIVDRSLDKKLEVFPIDSGAVRTIVVLDKAEVLAQATTAGWVEEMKSVVLSADEDNFAYNDEEIIGNGLAYTDDASVFDAPVLVLHDKHLLNRCSLRIEQTTVASNKVYFIVRQRSEISLLSADIQENNRRMTESRIPFHG